MTKAVLFDVDGVLVDSYIANFSFYRDLFNTAGYKPLSMEEYGRIHSFPMIEVIRSGIKDNLNDRDLSKLVELSRSPLIVYKYEELRLYEKVAQTLDSLNKEYILGIVTSMDRDFVFDYDEMARLKNYFKITVAYEDTTKHKPDPEPLLLASELLGLKPAECVYIGDSKNDILAAKSAGMKSIHFSKEPIDIADASTDNFSRIPKILASL